MQLPQSKTRLAYTENIKTVEAILKRVTAETIQYNQLQLIQEQLDKLAEKYQYDEEIGSARYKLYELQALVYYFKGSDDEAFDFINQAIETRGTTYARAEKLKQQLLSKPLAATGANTMTKQEQRKNLIGLEGWLALFIVGTFLSLVITVVRFFSDGFTSQSDIDTLNQYQTGLGNSVQSLTSFENIAIIIYISLLVCTLILLFRKSKRAKTLTIITLVFAAVYGAIDYGIASSLFESANLTQYVDNELGKYAGDVGRSIFGVIIWVPYFLVSKRVKRTLTKR